MLLTEGDTPDAAVSAYLDATAGEQVAIGGPAAAAYPDADPLVGDTREATATLVAERFFDAPSQLGVARLDLFADALAAGPYLARRGGPLVLTATSTLPDVTAAVRVRRRRRPGPRHGLRRSGGGRRRRGRHAARARRRDRVLSMTHATRTPLPPVRRVAAACVLAMAGLVLALATPAPDATAASWTEGACPDRSGITVVVDLQGLRDEVLVRCAPAPVESGYDALTKVGVDWTPTQRHPGFLCRIEGFPADDPCVTTPPPDAYWGYWRAAYGGSWRYSQYGPATTSPAPGPVDGWAFSTGDDQPPRVAPPPPPAPAPSPSPSPTATPRPSPPPSPAPTATPSPASPAPGTAASAPASEDAPATVAPSSPAPTPTTEDPTTDATATPEPTETDATATTDPSPTATDPAEDPTLDSRRSRVPGRRRRSAGRHPGRHRAGRGGRRRGAVGRPSAPRGRAPAMTSPTASPRLPRSLHPGAWWLWAIGMATAASRTTDPLVLALILAVVGLVVSRRRSAAPWARGFRAYLLIGIVVVGIRVLFRMLLDGQSGATVLFTLPELPLPDVAAGIRIGGPVSLEGILAAVYDGLRLATMLACIGAANALANPKRLLRAMPGALYEAGSAVVVALSVAAQLVESVHRVRRARRLRGTPPRGLAGLTSLVVPVMEDALDRSLALAAAMDARGYGRTGPAATRRARATSGALLLGGLVGVCVGLYGLLDGTSPRALGLPVLAGGVVVAALGLRAGGRTVTRTVHRPDPWRGAEWVVAAAGLVAAAALVWMAAVDPRALHPSTTPVAWPTLPLVPALGVLAGAIAGWAAPPPPDAPRRSRPAAASDAAAAPVPAAPARAPEVVA